MRWLAAQIRQQAGAVLVMGDFNATPFSPIFAEFLKATHLKNSLDGFGWQPSWPSLISFLGIPIDHVFVSSELIVKQRFIGPSISSDHLPVIAKLAFAAVAP